MKNGQPKTYCLASHKGGTGKTTSAINTSASFARRGHKTLLIDLDPQGHSTTGLGVDIGPDDHTIKDLFTDRPVPIEQIVRPTETANLDILPATLSLGKMVPYLTAEPQREKLLERALEPISGRYTRIVIDTPPRLDVLVEMALSAADYVLIPCKYEARAGEGVNDLAHLIAEINGPDFPWQLLLTQVDARKTLSIEVVNEKLAPWQDRRLKTEIPQNEKLNQAQMVHQHIFDFASKSSGADAYLALTEELESHV